MRTFIRTFKEYKEDNLTDWAAALTYYAVLSLFPALIVLVSLLGLLGQSPETLNTMLQIVEQVGGRDLAATIQTPLESITSNRAGAGALLSFGLLAALWTASGYIGAFMRASNSIYEVGERRAFKKYPVQVGITILMVLLLAVVLMGIVLTGPIATAIGRVLGIDRFLIAVWSYAKWPVMLLIVIFMVSVLYYVAPNAKQPGFKFITPGGTLAVLGWLLASLAFAFYLYTLNGASKYQQTYGSLGAVIIFLLWLFITNNALLFGAEFNAEVERGRELKRGLPAEDQLRLPQRDPPGTMAGDGPAGEGDDDVRVLEEDEQRT